VDETWTLPDLVTEAARRIAALPPPKNGQVRAVPDERTVRYYATLGLLDRPLAMRGRTALYGPRHVAQVVAIKRLQSAGRSLAEIQELWPSLDDGSLARMTGIAIPDQPRTARAEFWKARPVGPQLRIELAPGVALVLTSANHLDASDLRAIRAAAEPLVAELAKRGTLEEP
jgi:DNA-binding transcriptional MerR regulator